MSHPDNQTVTLSIPELIEIVRKSNPQPYEVISKPYATPLTPAVTTIKTVSEIGNPGALGLAGFAMTTFVLSLFNTGVFIDPSLVGVVLPLALFYGGIAQVIAGLFEYKFPNTFGATAFISYGSFWLSFAAYLKYIVPGLEATKEHEATGLFLFVWLIFTMYMFVGSLRVSKIVALVFFFLVWTFFFLMVGTFAGVAGLGKAGGWLGLLTALLAWYGSAAIVINSAHGRTVLPVGEINKSHTLMQSWFYVNRDQTLPTTSPAPTN